MTATSPKAEEGFWADAKVGESVHLRLFATSTGSGPGASVFDMKTNKSFSSREWADSIADAMHRAERIARDYCKDVKLKDPFPALVWKKTSDR